MIHIPLIMSIRLISYIVLYKFTKSNLLNLAILLTIILCELVLLFNTLIRGL